MEKELIELGEKLKEIAIKYNNHYVTLSYLDGVIMGNNDPNKNGYISIFVPKEEEYE